MEAEVFYEYEEEEELQQKTEMPLQKKYMIPVLKN
jgi:hypothetical protein